MGVPVPDLLDFTESDVLRDVELPRLVPRTTLLTFLNEAYQSFARHTHCFVTAEPFVVPANVRVRALPDRCVYVRWVRNSRGHELGDYTRKTAPLLSATGEPCAYTVDREFRTIEFHPTPSRQVGLSISYAYKPREVTDEADCLVALDLEHAYLLPEWVAWRALRNNDPDGSATIEARQFLERWNQGILDAKAFYIRHAAGPSPSVQPRGWT